MPLADFLHFAATPPDTSLLYRGSYDPLLVLLSLAIALFASHAALAVAGHMGHSPSRWERWMWTGVGGLTLGGGIWAMHFIGMLAFSLPCTVRYELGITLFSMLPGILASGVALHLISQERLSRLQLLGGGVLLGVGVGAMHYTGMAAYRLDGMVRYDPGLFWLSILVAMGLAILALWVHKGLLHLLPLSRHRATIVSTCLLGGAVSGMHYIAMGAAYFISDGRPEIPDSGLTASFLALSIGVVAFLLIALVLAATLISRQRQHDAQMRQALAIFENTSEGITLTDARGRILSVNPAFSRITGYTQGEILGATPRLFKSGRHDADFYKRMWEAVNTQGSWQGEIWNRRKNGEIYPQRLSINAVRDAAGAIQSYVGVFTDISHIKATETALEKLAHYDALTGLPNRTLFNLQLQHALERARRHDQRLAVLMLDLDGFKTVNDSLGHPAGDLLLQQAATRLRASLRQEDTVARLGGDEFAVLLESLEAESNPAQVALRFIQAIALPMDLQGHNALVTVSVGIALFPDDGRDATTLLKAADTAMYASKQAGRNTLRFHHSDMSQAVQRRLSLEQGLRRALEQDELEIWYQPQFELHSGRCVGAEALVRWRDPENGLIPPQQFIPLAEETGLILPLGTAVLRQACTAAQAWRLQGLAFGRLSVNVSGPQIERGDFLATVRQVLAETGLPAEFLILEITESFLLHNAERAIAMVASFNEMGIGVAIDDFGTGYSSLSYLKYLGAARLKIDSQFVHGLPDDQDDLAIARAVIALGHSLGFRITAEGVETRAQRDVLQALGCEEAQGYFYSKPLPADAFTAFLSQLPGP